MTWAADFKTAAFASLIATFGQSVTYTVALSAAESTINALWMQLEGIPNELHEVHFWIYADASLGVATPVNGDTVTYSGTVYTVLKSTPRANGAVWDLWCRDAELVT